ncbi:MAG: FMN-binding protein [Bacillota bacterium]
MKQPKKKKRRAGLIVLLCIVGVIVLGMAVTVLAFEPGRKETMNITVGDVDFSRLKDGAYTGAYKGTRDNLRDTAVEVVITNGEIQDIRVVEGALAGEKQNTEKIKGQTITDLFDRVTEQKTLQVDGISGATITTKTHLKALENALSQAQEN